MLAALIDGTTNPEVLADLALGKLRLELPARARAFVGSARHVADYPTDEVLTALAPDARAFLQRTSVLDRFTPELREADLGRHDSAARAEAPGLLDLANHPGDPPPTRPKPRPPSGMLRLEWQCIATPVIEGELGPP